MTPKEKAVELRDKMYLKIPAVFDPLLIPHFPSAKEMALIAVDEILKLVNDIWLDSFTNGESDNKFYNYWYEVKQEIEKL
jgi:hypothetical protein